ncbi:hypothetical protein [Lysinibacillus telephonicus]|uniref:hypothetical protein n=1 Tax=Lysinibacillus telephonicus TaxID=1714840 RepID=UPI0037D55AD3
MEDSINILHIPDDIGYWLVRADGGKYYDDFLINNFIAVSDNEITLEAIKSRDSDSIAGTTIEHYKALYSEIFKGWSSQQISHGASRTNKFVNEMKIGDIILVPSKKSTHFIIGIITSEVYEIPIEKLESKIEVQYAVTPYLKRRSVQWIKEVPRNEISEKLYWILSAHQTIFDLKEQKEYINQLLSPIYIQEGFCHGTLKISKKEGLNQNEWYDLYSIIKKQTENKEEVIIKSNVQSPGLIELVTANPFTTLSIMIALSGAIFGEISIGGIKLQGILPFYQSFRKGEVDIKKAKKELEILELDRKAKEIGNDRAQFELDKEKSLWETEITKKEAELVRERLQISNFDAGKVIQSETQMDSVDVSDEGES